MEVIIFITILILTTLLLVSVYILIRNELTYSFRKKNK